MTPLPGRTLTTRARTA